MPIIERGIRIRPINPEARETIKALTKRTSGMLLDAFHQAQTEEIPPRAAERLAGKVIDINVAVIRHAQTHGDLNSFEYPIGTLFNKGDQTEWIVRKLTGTQIELDQREMIIPTGIPEIIVIGRKDEGISFWLAHESTLSSNQS